MSVFTSHERDVQVTMSSCHINIAYHSIEEPRLIIGVKSLKVSSESTLFITCNDNMFCRVSISTRGRSWVDVTFEMVTWEGFQSKSSVISTCLQFSNSYSVGTRVSKYTVVPSIRKGMNRTSPEIPNGLVLSVGSSDTAMPKCCNWLGLTRLIFIRLAKSK